MNREYDAFEVLPDGAQIWRGTVNVDDDAIQKLEELAKDNTNEFRLMNVRTKTVIATVNSKTVRV